MGPGVSFRRGVSFSGLDVATMLDELAARYPGWVLRLRHLALKRYLTEQQTFKGDANRSHHGYGFTFPRR